MKSKETMYAKAVLALVDIYGFEYIKSKISVFALKNIRFIPISSVLLC